MAPNRVATFYKDPKRVPKCIQTFPNMGPKSFPKVFKIVLKIIQKDPSKDILKGLEAITVPLILSHPTQSNMGYNTFVNYMSRSCD